MKKILLTLSVIILLFAGCNKDDVFEEGEYGYKFTVTTNEVTDITATSARCDITVAELIAADGDIKITERGVCWSTSQNPTVNDYKTSVVTVPGTFYSLTNLTPNTTYYVRAYATNSAGTGYGDEVRFTTLEEDGGIINGHEYVDLGLPSGLKWATCNVGANNPEDYGDYFAWGETTTKSEYIWGNSLTDGLSISELQSQGIIDGDHNLTPSYDAARANWGGSWRMPTEAEQRELIDNCTWERTTQNGVNGYKVTGPNGNSIFLSAAGYRDGSSLYSAGEYGYYWSSTPDESDSDYAYLLFLYGSHQGGVVRIRRFYGQSVRPVVE